MAGRNFSNSLTLLPPTVIENEGFQIVKMSLLVWVLQNLLIS